MIPAQDQLSLDFQEVQAKQDLINFLTLNKIQREWEIEILSWKKYIYGIKRSIYIKTLNLNLIQIKIRILKFVFIYLNSKFQWQKEITKFLKKEKLL